MSNCNCELYEEVECEHYTEDGHIVERIYRCENCGKKTSIWSYGRWFDADE